PVWNAEFGEGGEIETQSRDFEKRATLAKLMEALFSDAELFGEPMLLSERPFTVMQQILLLSRVQPGHFRSKNCNWYAAARRRECLIDEPSPVIRSRMLSVPEPLGLTVFGTSLVFAYQACMRVKRNKRRFSTRKRT